MPEYEIVKVEGHMRYTVQADGVNFKDGIGVIFLSKAEGAVPGTSEIVGMLSEHGILTRKVRD